MDWWKLGPLPCSNCKGDWDGKGLLSFSRQIRLPTEIHHLGNSPEYEGIWMLTAKEETNITYRLVAVLIVSVVRDLSYSLTNRPDMHMTASARTLVTLMLPELRRKTGRIPTKVLDVGMCPWPPGLRFRKTLSPRKHCSAVISWPFQIRSNPPTICFSTLVPLIEMSTGVYQKVCTRMFIAALLIIAPS